MFYCWDYRLDCYYVIPLLCGVKCMQVIKACGNSQMNFEWSRMRGEWDRVFISIFKFMLLTFWKYFEYEVVLNVIFFHLFLVGRDYFIIVADQKSRKCTFPDRFAEQNYKMLRNGSRHCIEWARRTIEAIISWTFNINGKVMLYAVTFTYNN